MVETKGDGAVSVQPDPKIGMDALIDAHRRNHVRLMEDLVVLGLTDGRDAGNGLPTLEELLDRAEERPAAHPSVNPGTTRGSDDGG